MNLRFFLVDVQAHRGDGAVFEGGDEGRFVDDGPAGGVDDDDARFHEGELGGGEEVVGVRLGRGVSGSESGEGRGGKEEGWGVLRWVVGAEKEEGKGAWGGGS